MKCEEWAKEESFSPKTEPDEKGTYRGWELCGYWGREETGEFTIIATSKKIPGETLGIRANFALAGDPIESLNADGEWDSHGRQVADYRHDPWWAIEAEIDEFMDFEDR